MKIEKLAWPRWSLEFGLQCLSDGCALQAESLLLGRVHGWWANGIAGCLWSACPTLERKRAEVAGGGLGGEDLKGIWGGRRVQQGVRQFCKVPIEQLSGREL